MSWFSGIRCVAVVIVGLCFIGIGCAENSTPTSSPDEVDYQIFFRRDYEYLQRTYYDVGKVGRDADGKQPHLRPLNPRTGFPGDTILEFRLYGPGYQHTFEDPYAFFYIDPSNMGDPDYADESFGNYAHELELDEEYSLNPCEFWIRLARQHRHGDLLACWMIFGHGDGSGRDTIGALVDTLELKLLKPNRWNSSSSTWDYEWKNVYSIGWNNINYEDVDVDIFKGMPGTEREESNLNYNVTDSLPYLQMFGLDRYDRDGRPEPDGRIDSAGYLLDLQRGHLIFPNRWPFCPEPGSQFGVNESDRNAVIYRSSNVVDLREASIFYFRLRYVRPESTGQ